MLKIQIIKSTGFILATLTTLFFGGIQAASAQEKTSLNRTVLLEKNWNFPARTLTPR